MNQVYLQYDEKVDYEVLLGRQILKVSKFSNQIKGLELRSLLAFSVNQRYVSSEDNRVNDIKIR